jgi:hypothetical protein
MGSVALVLLLPTATGQVGAGASKPQAGAPPCSACTGTSAWRTAARSARCPGQSQVMGETTPFSGAIELRPPRRSGAQRGPIHAPPGRPGRAFRLLAASRAPPAGSHDERRTADRRWASRAAQGSEDFVLRLHPGRVPHHSLPWSGIDRGTAPSDWVVRRRIGCLLARSQ